MMIAAVAQLVEGLVLEALLTLKVPNFLSACTETSNIRNRMTVDFVHENVFQKSLIEMASSGIYSSKA
jgi:hypothetical protein